MIFLYRSNPCKAAMKIGSGVFESLMSRSRSPSESPFRISFRMYVAGLSSATIYCKNIESFK